jgi:RES domain-containing protein
MQVWRLCRAQFSPSAFDGEGAKLYGGRWNHKGQPMAYCSATLSLAVLEVLAHHRAPIPPQDFAAIPAVIQHGLKIETIHASDLPTDWRDDPAPVRLQEIGSDWLRRLSSLALAVPSVIVPLEFNYLINPRHADFAQLVIGPPQTFHFDPRFLR